MSWLAPIADANYSRSRVSRAGVILSKAQVKQVKDALSSTRRYSHERADLIRELAIKFGCYEGTIRRALMRKPK